MHQRTTVHTILALASMGMSASAQSLVSYWDFEDNLEDSATAGVTQDNGTWVGSAAFTATSPLGDGILLDGSNHVSIASSADFDVSAVGSSISGWFRVDQWDAISQTIFSKGLSPKFSVERNGETSGLRYVDGAGDLSGGLVDDGLWHHFAAVTTGTDSAELYVDGVQVGFGASSAITNSTTALLIGNNPEDLSRGWKGALDEIGFFQDPLNPQQAKAIYDLGKAPELKYRLPEMVQLFGLYEQGDGSSLLLGDTTWVYAVTNPNNGSTFVPLNIDGSGVATSSGPGVVDFIAQPNFTAPGNDSVLMWEVQTPFTAVTIDQGGGDVTGMTNLSGLGGITVNPTTTTTYTITATNANGSNLLATTIFVDLDPTAPRINEFVAKHVDDGEVDEMNVPQDWIEIYNPGAASVNLGTYYLTDDDSDLKKWAIPAVDLSAGGYLRIFASGEDLTGNPAFLHTNFSLSGSGEFLALTKDKGDGSGDVVVLNQFSPTYPEQQDGISYGYDPSGANQGFLETPTPAAQNGVPRDGFVGDTSFSVQRGFFDTAFELRITADTPGSTVRYTLDGSTPTETHGEIYNDASPIMIDETSTVRAFAYQDNFFPTNVDTQTYLFLEDIRTQYANGAAPDGWPSGSVNGQVFNYGMDPAITNRFTAEEMKDALRAIPSISMVTEIENLVDPQTGIYVNANQRGRGWERPGSVELINSDGSEGFQVDCGIRIRGGFSRSDNNPKHAFRLFFRGEYGDSSLNYPIFETEGAESFERVDLRTAQNYSWAFSAGLQNTYLREVLGRDLQGQTGEGYTRSRYYHLYVNGVYWGLFMTQERVDKNFAETYFSGDKDDFDTIKSAGSSGSYNTEASDGEFALGTEASPGSDWAALYFLTKAQRTTPTFERYMQLQGLNPDGSRNPSYPVLLDVDNLIWYTLVIGYTGNFDAPLSDFVNASNNWFSLRNRERDDRGFNFFVHDGEHTMGANASDKWANGADDRINTANGSGTINTYSKYNLHLAQNTEEYKVRFGDLAHQFLFTENGIGTKENVSATLDSRFSTVNQVIDTVAARWGDSKTSNPRDREDWEQEVDYIREIIDTRSEVFLGHLRQAELYPDLGAPEFSTNERSVPAGSSVFLLSDSDVIYYTTDGTDPRAVDENGNVSPNPRATAVEDTSLRVNLVDLDTDWRVLDTGDDMGVSSIVIGHPDYNSGHWKHPDFDDSAWTTHKMPIGFGGVSGMTFSSDSNAAGTGNLEDNNQMTSYFRAEFTHNPSDIFVDLEYSLQLDDACIVYLNGQEILRVDLPANVEITADTRSSNNRTGSEESEVATGNFDASLLLAGTNVVTIELHNITTGNSDLGLDFQMFGKQVVEKSPVVINQPTEVLSRTYKSETGEWSALNAGVFVPGIQPTSEQLVISEVNYRPAPLTEAEEASPLVNDRDDFEYIELTNISTTAVDLGGLSLVQRMEGLDIEGVTFTFPFGKVLKPGRTILIVADADAFPVRYSGVSPTKIGGDYSGRLGNGGEWIVLQDAVGNELAAFRYGVRDPWPSQPDGDGPTLNLASLGPNPNYTDPASWTAGISTPGQDPAGGFMGDPNADADMDGVNALMEYFNGTSDDLASSVYYPEATVVDVNGVEYGGIIIVRDPDAQATFSVQGSESLNEDWVGNGIFVSSEVLFDGRYEEIYRQETPLTDSSNGFQRLSVTAQ